MPVQKGKSAFAAKLGAKASEAIRKHAGDETTYGVTRLPGGINNGKAKLTKLYFDTYKNGNNVGEYYLRGEGAVVEPKSVATSDGVVPVYGKTTSMMRPVCETKNGKGEVTSFEENMAAVLNELRKLGADTSGVTDPAELEQIAADLVEAGPYFSFSTRESQPTKDYPTPRVWEQWDGVKGLEEYAPPDDDEGFRDASASPRPAANGKPPGKTPAVATSASSAGDDDEMIYRDDEDLDSLAKRADGGDEEAQLKLTEMAEAQGLADQAGAAPDYAAVADLLRGGGQDAAEPAPEAEGDWEPAKGEIYAYRPDVKGPGGKVTKAKKAIEVEVTAVDKKGRTADLVDVADKKRKWQKIKWDDLEQAT